MSPDPDPSSKYPELGRALRTSLLGAIAGFLALEMGRYVANWTLDSGILPHPGWWLGPWWPWTAVPIILLPPAIAAYAVASLSWRAAEGRATVWGTALLTELGAVGHVFLPVHLSFASLYATPILGFIGGIAGYFLRLEAARVAALD